MDIYEAFFRKEETPKEGVQDYYIDVHDRLISVFIPTEKNSKIETMIVENPDPEFLEAIKRDIEKEELLYQETFGKDRSVAEVQNILKEAEGHKTKEWLEEIGIDPDSADFNDNI